MFFGVDYQNEALANIVKANQIFLESNSNVKVSPYDETNHTNWEIKRNVPVEVMYVIYKLLIGVILIAAQNGFKRKLYKN